MAAAVAILSPTPHELNANDVDLTLVRWMLSRSPLERVKHIQRTAESLAQARREEAPQSTLHLLRVLAGAKIDCVVVGRLAGVLRGVPVIAVGVEVCYSQAGDNLGRLMAELVQLEAGFRRYQPERCLLERDLVGDEAQFLVTRLGNLVLRPRVEGERYQELSSRASPVDLGEGDSVSTLELLAQVELHRQTTNPTHRALLPVFEATLSVKA